MNSREKLIQRTMDVQREITKEGLKRRDLLKMGLLSASTGLLLPIPGLSLRAAFAKGGSSSNFGGCPVPGVDIISPPTRPWAVELPRLVEKQTVPGNVGTSFDIGNGGGLPAPSAVGTLTGGDSKIRCCSDFPALHTATPYPELDHQGWGKGGLLGNHTPQKWYEMRAKQFNHVWHPDLPAGLQSLAHH